MAGRRLLERGTVPRGDDQGRARRDLVVPVLVLLRRPGTARGRGLVSSRPTPRHVRPPATPRLLLPPQAGCEEEATTGSAMATPSDQISIGLSASVIVGL